MRKKISFIALVMTFALVLILPVQATGPYTLAAVFIGGMELRIGLGLLVGAVLAIIICMAVRAGMKSVRPKSEAGEYVVGQLKLTSQHDQYTHTTTQRMKINNNSSKR